MIWQNIFALAVLVEIVGLAILPNFGGGGGGKKRHHGKGELPMTMVVLLRRILLPTIPASDLCTIWQEKHRERHDDPLAQVLDWIADLFQPDLPVTAAPWHCDFFYQELQRVYIIVMGFLINRAMGIVSFMFFLDVFVHFFTGRIDPKTGRLVPRGFFERWFFPGLFLELACKDKKYFGRVWNCMLLQHLVVIFLLCLTHTHTSFSPCPLLILRLYSESLHGTNGTNDSIHWC
jgi:hypothetical protein